MKKQIISILFVIILSLIFFSGCSDKNANVIHVNIKGEGDFKNIQEAIDNAPPGSTIYVDEGVYYELLTIRKSINLICENNEKTSIIQSNVNSNHDSIISVNADNCVIKGFKIICYKISNIDINGINISSSNNIISNNIINGPNKGIYLTKSSENNKIFDNNILNSSNGIYAFSSDNNNITKNNVTSSESYGIYIIASINNFVFNNMVFDNNYGMRIMNSESNFVFNNSIIGNNRGILFCCSSSKNVIYNNIFKENEFWSASDEIDNQWDNGKIGNYWNDYTSKYPDATQKNGIWDTPYKINDGVNIDRYPLVNPPN